MAVTKESIISLAVMLLGHKPIITLDNQDDLVTAAEQFYDMLLPSILSTGNWRFAVQISQLSLSPMEPPVGTNWRNIYYLPAGFLKNIRIIPNNYVYEIYTGGLIYTNWGTSTPIYMEYSFVPPTELLPMHFINYFIYEIAAPLALVSAQKPDFYQALLADKVKQHAMAAATDSQNRPQYSQVDIPMLNNRNITGIIGPSIG